MSIVGRERARSRSLITGRPAEIDIAPMRRRDLKKVLAIESECYPRPWSRRVFEDELGLVVTGSRRYLTARIGRRIVGYGGLWLNDEAHVTNVAVDPGHRRHGIATRLMIDMARHAIAHGCRAWTLEVRRSSTGAQDLYRLFGFAPAGLRSGYYENGEDALIMWCHDLAEPAYADRLDELEQSLRRPI